MLVLKCFVFSLFSWLSFATSEYIIGDLSSIDRQPEVFIASVNQNHQISIFGRHIQTNQVECSQKTFKFPLVNIADKHYGIDYKVDTNLPKSAFSVILDLGFKEPQLIDQFIKKIYNEWIGSEEIFPRSAFKSMNEFNIPPDFKYGLINSRVDSENELSIVELFTIKLYRDLKSIGLTITSDFRLETTNTVEEKILIKVSKIENSSQVKRIS